MKIEINTELKQIKLIVSNTDAMEVLDILDKFDADEWDGYDIIIDGKQVIGQETIIINTPRYSPPCQTYPFYYGGISTSGLINGSK